MSFATRTFLLATLGTLGASATAHADARLETLTSNARLAARSQHCQTVAVLSDQVHDIDATYHANVFMADPGIVACERWLDTQVVNAPGLVVVVATAATAPKHRVGVDGQASFGIIAAAGGSVRYERRWETSSVTLRLGGLSGVAIESEDDGFDAAVAQIGYRAYLGSSYFAIEAGATAIRRRAYYNSIDDEERGAEWHGFPAGSLTFGTKLADQVDFGVSGLFPFIGVGLHLGVDFSRW